VFRFDEDFKNDVAIIKRGIENTVAKTAMNTVVTDGTL
jgi:hypothetical protein